MLMHMDIRLLILSMLLVLVSAPGCQEKKSAISDTAGEKAPAAPTLKPTKFDGERALEHVRKQVEFGPRPSGTPALKQTREYIIKELQSYGLKVQTDAFKARTPNPKFPEVEMINVIAEIPGESEGIIIVSSHYDTKWFPDITFLGANDGGSSTGTLLEIARQLAGTKPKYTLWLVFFDGEESMAGPWENDDHTYGSRHMAESLRKERKTQNIRAMILLDMIGDRDLNIKRDVNSINWMNDIIWRNALQLGYGKNFPDEENSIDDDHIPFLRAGIPAVDLIDLKYGTGRPESCGEGGFDNCYWHTAQDTMDKISAQSLKVVGDTVLLSLPEIAEKMK
jgi:glutaminyl-peptide cyclotransferase